MPFVNLHLLLLMIIFVVAIKEKIYQMLHWKILGDLDKISPEKT